MHSYSRSIDPLASVGVLPLKLTGMTADERYFGTVMAEEISMALSRFRVISVVSPLWLGALIQGGHDEASIRSVCRIDFLVSGSIERIGQRSRTRLKLFDLRTDRRVVWTHRFDRNDSDFPTLLEEISTAAVGRIIPHILVAEGEQTAVFRFETAPAYDLALHAVRLMKSLDRRLFYEAGSYLAESVRREPHYSPGHTWFAFWHLFVAVQGWTKNAEAAMLRSCELATSAMLLDPGDAFAMTINAHVIALRHRRLGVAADLHERALALNPNLALAWALSAMTYSYMGEMNEAEKRFEKYMTFGPFDPSRIFFADSSMLIGLSKGDYAAVAESGRTATKRVPSHHGVYKPYLAALGYLRRVKESDFIRSRLLSIEPGFSVECFLETSSLERERDREHFAEGLRLAGVPETSRSG